MNKLFSGFVVGVFSLSAVSSTAYTTFMLTKITPAESEQESKFNDNPLESVTPLINNTVSIVEDTVGDDTDSNEASFPIAPTPKPTLASPGKSGGCVVTIFGTAYDLSPLRATHSGGDIFICGSDMTNTFQKQHGSNTARISQYSLDTVASNPTPTNSPISTIGSANACLVTVFGKVYNLAALRSTHSGGNVFSCDTDMSSFYLNQHGTNVTRIAQYLSTTGTPVSATPAPVVTSPPGTCVVMLWGKLYNVAKLRREHEGGDIFICGADMTAIFQNQHGTKIDRMKEYAYDPNNPGPTPEPHDDD